MTFVVLGTFSNTKTKMNFVNGKIADDEILFLMESNLESCNSVEFSSPINTDYDGTTGVLLDYYEEYDTWYIYD